MKKIFLLGAELGIGVVWVGMGWDGKLRCWQAEKQGA
jgi:hypothetical protein